MQMQYCKRNKTIGLGFVAETHMGSRIYSIKKVAIIIIVTLISKFQA